MIYHREPLHRRRFLRQAGGVAVGLGGTVLLSACGGGGAASGTTGAVEVVSAPVAVVPAPTPVPTATAPPDAVALNLALNVAYLGAQYHGRAATGEGIAGTLITGVGRQGGVTGARRVTFADDGVARLADELAGDKLAQVTALRGLLGGAAAAQPTIDFAGGAATAARGAGLVAGSGGFDPFAGDDGFLIGALLIEDVVAAAYRSLLAGVTTDAATQLLTGQLGEAIYHGGLVRTVLADRAASDPALGTTIAAAATLLARLDGSAGGDQSLAADATSADLPVEDGAPLPFLRSPAQVLNILYLTAGSPQPGGFFPNGVNAVQL